MAYSYVTWNSVPSVTQVSIHVAATHKTFQHQKLKSQIQMVEPYARLA